MKCFCPETKGPRQSDIIGCGAEFDAEPDGDGLVDCPECGIAFNPVKETPDDATLIRAAMRLHTEEGSVEVDEQVGDPTVMVSRGQDAGAYVRAWVWVPFAEISDEDWKGADKPERLESRTP